MDIAARLRAAGMSDVEADTKAALLARCATHLDGTAHPSAAQPAFYVPGRIEVLGKHTDYAGGRSLLCAMERGFVVQARRRTDAVIRVTDVLSGESREASLDPSLDVRRGDWSAYVATVARRIARNFPEARHGADVAFASDLPAASGMSSSSAFIIAIFAVLDSVNELSGDTLYRGAISSPETLAGYLATVENGQSFGPLAGDAYGHGDSRADDEAISAAVGTGEGDGDRAGGVGSMGGSEDHTAILCCRAGTLSRYAFTPVRLEEQIPFPAGRAFVVAYSGVAAEKTGAAQQPYNEVSRAARRILFLWNAATRRRDPSLAAAIASADDATDRIRVLLRESHASDFTPQRLGDRLEQFVAESFDLIPRATEALARGDLSEFGDLVDRSQALAESRLGNQIPETIALARMARVLGADAASAFGAGFGGSVWALTPAADVDRFAQDWRARYRREFPAAANAARFIVTMPGPPMTRCD